MNSNLVHRCIAGFAMGWLLLLAGCSEEQAEVQPEPVRAIKYMTLERGAAAQQRRIAGVVAAGTSSVAAFETAGQVIELTHNVGDTVAAGDLLAWLDPEPFRLRLAEAEAKRDQARAAVADAESKYQQQNQLFDKGYATRTARESALATLRNARGALGVAESQVQIASRNLGKTELKAPFSGVIARRTVEPFEEVASGQEVYTLQTEGESEVKVSLPETLVNVVSVGDPVDVIVSLLSSDAIQGRVAEVSPLAEGVNAYPVTIRLEETLPGLRPGMSAQVLFQFRPADTSNAFTVPISALKPKVGEEGGFVYVFDAGTLDERAVQVVNLRDNSLQIVGEIHAGASARPRDVALVRKRTPI